MKKKFTDRQKEVSEAASHGEELVEFKSRGSSVFNDPKYGEFTCNYYSFVKGKSCHPRRRDYSHNKIRVQKTVEDGRDMLVDAGIEHILLLEWDGLMTSVAKFRDEIFGDFEKEFRQVLKGLSHHPERIKKNRSERSKKLWKSSKYRSQVVEKIKSTVSKAAEKRASTMLDKYGVKHALQNSFIKKKQEQTSIKRYGKPHFAQTNEFKTCHAKTNPFIHSADTVYQSRIESGSIKTYSGETMGFYAKKLGKAYTTFQSQVKKYGIDHALRIQASTSGLELLMKNILNELPCSYEEQFSVGQYRSDFRIDNLIIEVDGLFWHSDYNIKNKVYHKKKKESYQQAGFDALFFREHEIVDKPKIVSSIVQHYLGKSKRVFARKTEIRIVPKSEGRRFLDNNHLMGAGGGKMYGLYLDSDLMTVLQIRRMKGGVKIERFCHRIGYTVVGGYSKLLKCCVDDLKPNKVVNFVDQRYGTGTHLKKYGFELLNTSLSFAWTDGKACWHRLNFPGNSGYEKGLRKIWDCGQSKYVLYV